MNIKYYTKKEGYFEIENIDDYIRNEFIYNLSDKQIEKVKGILRDEGLDLGGWKHYYLSEVEDDCYHDMLVKGGQLWEIIDEIIFHSDESIKNSEEVKKQEEERIEQLRKDGYERVQIDGQWCIRKIKDVV